MKNLAPLHSDPFPSRFVLAWIVAASAIFVAALPAAGSETRTTFAARVVVPPKAEITWGEVGTELGVGADCAALEKLLTVLVPEGSPLLLSCVPGTSDDKGPGPKRHRLVVTLRRLDQPSAGDGQAGAPSTTEITINF